MTEHARPCDITDTQRKIEYRRERIASIQHEQSILQDRINILNHEIAELEELLR